jgi:hypothetical protein
MGLLPQRETAFTSLEYNIPFQQERGGVLSLATLSGIQYAVYEFEPSADTVPLGIMQFDTSEVDLYRQIPPWRSRNEYPPFVPQAYITRGVVVTNAIHPDVTEINLYDRAYIAPSGLITNSTVFGTREIGVFMSPLNYEQLGAPQGASQLRVGGDNRPVNPENIIVPTAGWAKLRVSL